jgi:hydrogenase-4 transcriptional activator
VSTLSPQYRLIVDVWAAATGGGGAPIVEVAERVAELLGRASLGQWDSLTIWRETREGRAVESVAASRIRSGVGLELTRRVLSPDALAAWESLAARPTVERLTRYAPLAEAFGPEQLWREAIAIPLRDQDRLAGVAVVAACEDGQFTQAAVSILEEIGPPLTAALRLHNEHDSAEREREALEADRRALLQRLDRDEVANTLVGSETGLRQVMLRTEQVAPTDAPVLLFGETGVGKEVVARAIHTRSRRARGPIVRVNCGAIPLGLIDSELFGHEKGSFTGAVATRKGWFERAHGGTLFLDEIGELPLDAQVRLLRILQDGVFERVGAQRSNRVDVRIIAATNRNLHDMVSEGRFREDLWYRLSVFPIEIPPLRARPEDIPALASHFAARAGARLGGAALVLTPEDVELLLAYPWPGNVRELAAVVERAAILGDGKRLKLQAALGPISREPASVNGARNAVVEDPTIDSLDEAMARHIERALRVTSGRIEGRGGAAALLRVNPHTLRSRMRKLGVDWARIRDEVRDER